MFLYAIVLVVVSKRYTVKFVDRIYKLHIVLYLCITPIKISIAIVADG